jgi:hypothetical protein
LIASDLPLLQAQAITRLDREMDKLLEKSDSAIVICPSKKLGSSTIYSSNLKDICPLLGVSSSNLMTQLVLYKNKPKQIVFEFGNYFDLDEPQDLSEIFYLLRFFKPDSETYKFLSRNKWDFLLPSEGDQKKVLDKFRFLLDSRDLDFYINTGQVFEEGNFIYSVIKDKEITIFVTTSFLAPELLHELSKTQLSHSVAFSVKWKKYIRGGREYSLRIAAFGIPCQKVLRVLMKVVDKNKSRR